MISKRSRTRLGAATATAIALALAGCGAVTNGTTSGSTAVAGGGFVLADYIQKHVDEKQQLVIKLSYHDPSLAFAKPIAAGMEKAGRELGVNVQFIGPTGGDAAKQVSELQTLITQKQVDGIAVSSASSDALKPVIAQAFNAGIPIISFNTDNPGSKQMAFVGQDLKGSGTSQAQQLLKSLRAAGTTSGKVVVFSLDTGAGWSNDRFAGFTAGMQGSGFEVVGPVNTGNEPSAAYNTVESTMKGQTAVAIAGLDCCSTTAVGTWVEQSGNRGKILVAGFDVLPRTAEFLKDGAVSFTISQNPGDQGYQAVKVLDDFLTTRTPPATVDTGAQFVTPENLPQVTVEG